MPPKCNLNLELLKLPDCAGLLENGKCEYLDVPGCQGKNCTFYNGQKKAFARLLSLDEEKQNHISQKYYSGKRPWSESSVKPSR